MSLRRTAGLLLGSISLLGLLACTASAQEDIWVSAYFASWTHAVEGRGGGHVRTDDIDWDSFTELNYFALVPNADGSLCCTEAGGNMTPDRVGEIVAAAHAHDKPILVSVGGWGTYDGFRAAIRPGSRANLVRNIVDYLVAHDFDGVDVDMEPIHPEDRDDFVAFVRELRAALEPLSTPMLPRPRLTAAVQWEAAIFGELADEFDQVNIMTYDMAGAWSDDWVSWHNSTLHNGGQTFPSHGGPLPSAMGDVARFREAGVPSGKLGIGIDFYGYTWQGGRRASAPGEGITGPLQSWAPGAAPAVTDNVPFHELARRYGLVGDGSSSPLHRWDEAAGAGYLSIDEPGADADVFVSYDDARAIREKIEAVRSEGLGGVIIWELGGGIRVDAAGADRNALLDAVGEALHEGEPPAEPEDPMPEDPSAPSPDDGEPPADPASPVTDAGAPADIPGDPGAAAAPAEVVNDGGCSVSPASAAAPPTALLLAGLFALLLRRRTRRRARARRG